MLASYSVARLRQIPCSYRARARHTRTLERLHRESFYSILKFFHQVLNTSYFSWNKCNK